ncbi:hypothetical protein ElyMa_001922400 [Elysia marginata]|uniref:Uncharacterized protein n=1 Tax=Elysia marginata TaxID=1093978 RepID=A0AAV4EUK6_9GAST|nr:hypothetical protein ElyMa_001922400 [Elysia marginata]
MTNMRVKCECSSESGHGKRSLAICPLQILSRRNPRNITYPAAKQETSIARHTILVRQQDIDAMGKVLQETDLPGPVSLSSRPAIPHEASTSSQKGSLSSGSLQPAKHSPNHCTSVATSSSCSTPLLVNTIDTIVLVNLSQPGLLLPILTETK